MHCRLYFFLTLLLCGCAEEQLVYNVDARLEHYVQRFYEEANQRGLTLQRNNLIVLITKDLLANEKRLAVTRGNTGNQIRIEVDEGFVMQQDSLYIEFAVMHECGHGFLKREHTYNYSIMNPVRKSLSGYRKNALERARLLDELFRPEQ